MAIETATLHSHSGTNHKHLLCWRSTIAGLAVAFVTYVGALALAAAFGGIGLSDGASAQNAGIFAGTSVVLATALATFVGAYFATRVSGSSIDVVGSMQGLLVGALFLGLMIVQMGAVFGGLVQVAAQNLGAPFDVNSASLQSTEARETAATALQAMGWGFFVVLSVGMITASLGGLTASLLNKRATLEVPMKRKGFFLQRAEV